MRHVPALAPIASVSLALLVSCGGKGRPVHGQVAHDIDQFVADWTEAQCAKVFECCTAGEVHAVLGEAFTATDQASCVSELRPYNQVALALAEAEIGHGTAHFDAARARACVEATRAMTCAAMATHRLYEYGVDCPSPVIGTLPDQAACEGSAACQSGYCAGALSEGQARLGEAAIEDSGMALDKPRARGGVCQPHPAVGEPCPDYDCAPGARCVRDPDGMPDSVDTCVAYLADGEACEDEFDCAAGGCVDGVCGPPVTCDGT